MITITIPGEPVAKGRPRFAQRSKHMVAYTPGKTATYENMVGYYANLAMAGGALISGPVAAIITLDVSIPASWPKKKQAAALAREIYPTSKPDLDNCAKLILDALNGIVWVDDKQVVRLHIVKRFGAKPQAEIAISQCGSDIPNEL